jgi:hypothetical protein
MCGMPPPPPNTHTHTRGRRQVRRYLDRLNDYKHTDCEDVLILSGDQL